MANIVIFDFAQNDIEFVPSTMRKKSVSFELSVYNSIDHLPDDFGRLLFAAIESLAKSYAPYSTFYVGAAVLLQNDKIITGANFENASYPLALCAERVALAAAASQYPRVPVKAIAVTARNPLKALTKPIPPCGACRQVISEIEKMNDKSIRMILGCENSEIYVLDSASYLLPFSFDADFL